MTRCSDQQPSPGGIATCATASGLRRRGFLKGAVAIAASVLGSFTARAETPTAEVPKKKAYSIVDVQIRDKDVFYKEYVPGHSSTLIKFGGRFLVATSKKQIIEGDWPSDHVVVIHEWPDLEHFHNWYESPDYTPWKKLRHSVSTANVILVEGV